MCTEGGVGLGGEARAFHPSCPQRVLPGLAFYSLTLPLTRTLGVCFPLVVLFSMAEGSVEVSLLPAKNCEARESRGPVLMGGASLESHTMSSLAATSGVAPSQRVQGHWPSTDLAVTGA